MKKTIAILLALVMTVSLLAGCSKGGGNDGEKTLTVALTAAPPIWTPIPRHPLTPTASLPKSMTVWLSWTPT